MNLFQKGCFIIIVILIAGMKPHLVDFTRSGTKPWVLAFSLGQRTKNGSADTLKKQCAALLKKAPGKPSFLEGFVQVLPARVVGSPTHLEWAGFALLSSVSSNSLHFRQLELEFLARVAGTFQWKDVLSRVALRDSDESVVFAWMSPSSEWNEKLFHSLASEWGFSPRAWPAVSTKDAVFALERSALAGLG